MSERLHTVWQIALADFRERTRRSPFFVALVSCAWMAYMVYSGKAEVTVGANFGFFNSAWCAAVMAMMANTVLSLFAFFVVKNTVERDDRLAVGRLLASTAMHSRDYIVGKTLSNFMTLMALSLVFLMGAPLFQWHRSEGYPVQPLTLVSQFVLLVAPTMAFIAALAVLWECIPLLRRGFGNVLYVIVWMTVIASTALKNLMGTDLFGYVIFMRSTRVAEIAQGITSAEEFELNIGHMESNHVGRFLWNGVDWNLANLWSRLEWVLVAGVICVFALTFFRRFDPDYGMSFAESRWKAFAASFRRKRPQKPATQESKWAVASMAHLSSLDRYAQQFQFVAVLRAELRLMLRGVPKVMYIAVALANFIAMVAPRSENMNLLPLLWLLPVLLWSQMGTRERSSNTSGLLFSAPHSFLRQLPALWLAGVLVAAGSSIGMIVRAAGSGNRFLLMTCIAGGVFIPSLALACGVWSNTPRLFEALYVTWWYIALNGVPDADFMGMTQHGSPSLYFLLGFALLGTALARRWWDVERGAAERILMRRA